jgi:hypothetical protein
MLVGHDATSIFLYLHHPVKGPRTKGRQVIAVEFDDRSPAEVETGRMITSVKLVASVMLAAFPPAVFRAAIPNH